MNKFYGCLVVSLLLSSIGFAGDIQPSSLRKLNHICSQLYGEQSSREAAQVACYKTGIKLLLDNKPVAEILQTSCDAATAATQGSVQSEVRAKCYGDVIMLLGQK